jgi:predicted O-methyltransferase YrrM
MAFEGSAFPVMNTQLPIMTRIKLKAARIARELMESPLEREWRQLWTTVDPIEGWLLPAEGKWLFDSARAIASGGNIVEIGSFKGRSTCCLAGGSQGRSRVFAIDPFDGGPDLPRADSLADFRGNLSRCSLSAYVEPIVGLSFDIAKSWNHPIHLLFIDGSHKYEDALADFVAFSPHVVAGGKIAFHDVNNAEWPGVGRAWTEINHSLRQIGYCESLGFGQKPHPR